MIFELLKKRFLDFSSVSAHYDECNCTETDQRNQRTVPGRLCGRRGRGGWTVVGGTVVAIVVTAGVVATTLGVTVGTEASRTLNSAVPVAVWRTAVSVTRYSSGLNVDESTSKEIAFRPLSPLVTLTVPVAPLNSPLWLLSVGLNDDE